MKITKRQVTSFFIVCLATLACLQIVYVLNWVALYGLQKIEIAQVGVTTFLLAYYYLYTWMRLIPLVALLYGMGIVFWKRDSWQAFAIYFGILANLCLFWIGFTCLAMCDLDGVLGGWWRQGY